MNKLLLSLFSFCIAAAATAQVCTPVHDFGDETYGVYPDTNQNFEHAFVNEPYFQQIDVKLPSDGSDIGIPVTIDSAQIISVSGLPSGITWQCGDPDCTYNGGEIGCGVFSGTATVADTFDLVITTTLYGSVFGTALEYPMLFTGYKIIVDGPVGINQQNAVEFVLYPSQPNPAQNRTKIRYSAPTAGTVELQVFDLLGKQIFYKTLEARSGENDYVLQTAELGSGLYIYSIYGFDQLLSRKLMVRH